MSEFSPHELRDALGRVVGSREFVRSEQLRGLLSYLVEAAIKDRADTLKESVIGVEFFGLPSDFDPKRDPVVRMAMRRLRDRLQRYYFGDGAADQIVIALKPGSYTPQFLLKPEKRNSGFASQCCPSNTHLAEPQKLTQNG